MQETTAALDGPADIPTPDIPTPDIPDIPDVPAPDDLAPALRMAVMRLARRLRLEDTAADATISQLSALAVIEKHGPIGIGDLAARERVQPPTMTRMVTNLESLGLIDRAGDARDRRVVRVAITAAGSEALADSRRRRTAFLAANVRTLPETERRALLRALPILERLADA